MSWKRAPGVGAAWRKAIVVAMLAALPARAEPTPEQWIEWGSRVHGGFGTLIAVGIRVGEDARLRLGAQRRQLDVSYLDSPAAPCPCVVDGVIVAVSASPGQKTLRIADTAAAAGLFGEVLFRHRASGAALRYCLRADALGILGDGQRLRDFRERYDLVNALAEDEIYYISSDPERCLAPR